jgi:hypothetical protein
VSLCSEPAMLRPISVKEVAMSRTVKMGLVFLMLLLCALSSIEVNQGVFLKSDLFEALSRAHVPVKQDENSSEKGIIDASE